MAAGIAVPEPSIQVLLDAPAAQAPGAALVLQLLAVAVDTSNLPRAVRIARSAHRAGAISCYPPPHAASAPAAGAEAPLADDAPEGLPGAQRTLHVEYLPPRLVPSVLLAWLAEVAEHAATCGDGSGGGGGEEPPYVVVTGVAPEAEGGEGGSGGGTAVPTLDMWSSNNRQASVCLQGPCCETMPINPSMRWASHASSAKASAAGMLERRFD